MLAGQKRSQESNEYENFVLEKRAHLQSPGFQAAMKAGQERFYADPERRQATLEAQTATIDAKKVAINPGSMKIAKETVAK